LIRISWKRKSLWLGKYSVEALGGAAEVEVAKAHGAEGLDLKEDRNHLI
jgi:hypothetical protein